MQLEAQILSVPPVFDSRLAGTLLVAAGIGRADEIDHLGASAVQSLIRSGVTSPGRGWWIFDEPVRADLLSTFQKVHLDLYRTVAQATVHSMANGSAHLMEQALGRHGAGLTASVLSLGVAGDAESKVFGRLVRELETSAQAGRVGDTTAVGRLLEYIPPTVDRDRQRNFISGLTAWQNGMRPTAASRFLAVWRSGIEDEAYAISAHLLAAYEQARNNPEGALPYATHAVRVLEALDDRRGLALALTTLGRIERDLVDRDPDAGTEMVPLNTLQRAVDVGRESSLRQAGIALGYLAGALQRQNLYDEALDAAEESKTLMLENDPALLPVLTLLGSLYQSVGEFEKGRDALLAGIDLAESVEDSLQLAILLNVLAGSDRRTGRLDDAVRHARRSVELGLALNNDRHLSQAYNTLATVLVEASRSSSDLTEALDVAVKSRALLGKLGDTRGMRMIERTIRTIHERVGQG
jgi:tetratricopeptide (TPR) repeat protein